MATWRHSILFRTRPADRTRRPAAQQAAAHMADAYYRASGKPLTTMTSIGPGSMNVATGSRDRLRRFDPADLIHRRPQTYMLSRGVSRGLRTPAGQCLPSHHQPMVGGTGMSSMWTCWLMFCRGPSTTCSQAGPVRFIELPMDVPGRSDRTAAGSGQPSGRPTSGAVRPDGPR